MRQKSVLVTGANGGIGKAICTKFLEEGWAVLGSDIHEVSYSPQISYVSLDLRRFTLDDDYRNHKIEVIRGFFPSGQLDALVNNAALQIVAKVQNLSVSNWQETISVNLIAPFLLIQSTLDMLERAQGAIVNISSIHAQLTKPGFVAYSTSKAALSGLTRGLAVELGRSVRVNAICPAAISTDMLIAGFADTPEKLESLKEMHPRGCIGEPNDVAEAAFFLCSPLASFINGEMMALDGGIGARLHDPS